VVDPTLAVDGVVVGRGAVDGVPAGCATVTVVEPRTEPDGSDGSVDAGSSGGTAAGSLGTGTLISTTEPCADATTVVLTTSDSITGSGSGVNSTGSGGAAAAMEFTMPIAAALLTVAAATLLLRATCRRCSSTFLPAVPVRIGRFWVAA